MLVLLGCCSLGLRVIAEFITAATLPVGWHLSLSSASGFNP
jgi:hypothetical protein